MNDVQIIRTATLELQTLDDTEVVKIAGVLQRIKNWWQAFKSPEYRQQVQQLKQESTSIKSLIDSLSNNITDLQKAISSNDVQLYGDSLNKVRYLAGQLASDVSVYQQKAEEAHQAVPDKLVERLEESDREIRHVTKDKHKDPDVRKQLAKQLPPGYDLQLGRQRTPVSSSKWMRQFSLEDVQFSQETPRRIIKDLSRAVARYMDIDEEEAVLMVAHNRKQLEDNIIETFLKSGQINNVDFSRVSDQITHRPSNQMKYFTSVWNIPIPGTDIMFDIPNFVLVDIHSSLVSSKKLSVYYADHIRISSPVNKSYASRVEGFEKLAAQNVHQWARDILTQAFKQTMGRDPTVAELQLAQAVSWHESNYGRGWKADKNPDGRATSSNNWGAVQSGMPKGSACPVNSFMYTDTHPTTAGVNVPYQVCFKTYPTPVDGAADVVKLLFKSKSRGPGITEAARTGSVNDFSTIMYDTKYYEGWGKTREERIAGHANRMRKTVQTISTALNEKPQFNDMETGTKVPASTEQKDIMNEYDELIPLLLAANAPVTKLVKQAMERKTLPITTVLIRLNGEASFASMVKLARITTMALREEFGAISSIYENGENVEIESDIAGSENNVVLASDALIEGLAKAFKDINGIEIKAEVGQGKSDYNLLTSKVSEECNRKFAMERF